MWLTNVWAVACFSEVFVLLVVLVLLRPSQSISRLILDQKSTMRENVCPILVWGLILSVRIDRRWPTEFSLALYFSLVRSKIAAMALIWLSLGCGRTEPFSSENSDFRSNRSCGIRASWSALHSDNVCISTRSRVFWFSFILLSHASKTHKVAGWSLNTCRRHHRWCYTHLRYHTLFSHLSIDFWPLKCLDFLLLLRLRSSILNLTDRVVLRRLTRYWCMVVSRSVAWWDFLKASRD